MELFGLKLPAELRRQPIDVSYITLTSSKATSPGQPAAEALVSQPKSFTLPLDIALEELGKASNTSAPRPRYGRHALRGVRVLLTGPAGSGKTTAAQWLTLKAAQHNFTVPLKAWNACMPFIVPLRDAFGTTKVGRSRTVDDLIQPKALRKLLPPDWVGHHLQQESIIIFDGLDELSDIARVAFEEWLSKLSADFPTSHIIVASRPEGLNRGWFRSRGFAELELQPMEAPDSRRCINSWFKALLLVDQTTNADITANRDRLLADLDRHEAVSELAETPLLCAMLCSFYAYNLSATAPQSRNELYEQVLNSLVDARERARNPEQADLYVLPLKPKLILLQAMARYMTDHGLSSIVCSPRTDVAENQPTPKYSTAEQILDERLLRMRLLQMDTGDALDTLLKRSVVFRRVGFNEAHFVHRSLQEYLTACEYASEGAVSDLLDLLPSPAWWKVIAFTAGRLAVPQASELVTGILDLADTQQPTRRPLLLLAAECYLAAGSLAANVASRVQHNLQGILPPSTLDEAEVVARGGAEILPLLHWRESYSDETASSCVRTAALIGGVDALNVVAGYASPNIEKRLLAELLYNWRRFNASEYVDRVLSRLNFGDAVLVLSFADAVDTARNLESVRRVRIESSVTDCDFGNWASRDSIEELDIAEAATLPSIQGLSELRSLKRLNLSGTLELRDLTALDGLPSLRELYLINCPALSDLSSIAGLRSLRVLVVDGCTQLTDLSAIAALSNLRTLSLDRCRISTLSFVSALGNLRTLRADTAEGLADTSALVMCAQLRRLKVSLKTDHRELVLPDSGELNELQIKSGARARDLRALARHQQLRSLSVQNIPDLRNLSIECYSKDFNNRMIAIGVSPI